MNTTIKINGLDVEKAYDEGCEDMRSKDNYRNWASSRACAVTDGGQ